MTQYNEVKLADALKNGAPFNPNNLVLQSNDAVGLRPPEKVGEHVIPADVLTRLLRNLRLADGSAFEEPRLIHFVGVTIEGDVDLMDYRGAKRDFAPPLVFECCRFTGKINLSHSRLSRLSLRGSRFTELELDHCRLESALDLRCVASSGYEKDEDNPLFNAELFATPGLSVVQSDSVPVIRGRRIELCWVRARSTQITGDILASGAKLCSPTPETHGYAAGGRPFALDFSRADITGTMALQPDLTLIGGLCIYEARISGSIWLGGASIRSLGDQAAVRAQSVQVGEHFQLRESTSPSSTLQPFSCIGQIDLLSARITGEVRISGGTIHRSVLEDPDSKGGRFGTEIDWLVSLWMSHLGGLYVGADQSQQEKLGTVIHGGFNGLLMKVDTAVTFDEYTTIGSVPQDMEEAKDEDEDEDEGTGAAPSEDRYLPFTRETLRSGGGMIYLKSIRTEGGLDLAADVEGELNLDEICVGAGARLAGRNKGLDLNAAQIRGSLVIGNGRIGPSAFRIRPALMAEGMQVDGNVELLCKAEGGISLARSRIDGELRLGRHHRTDFMNRGELALIWSNESKETGFQFDLSEIEIGQSLQVGQIDIVPGNDVRANLDSEAVRLVRQTRPSFYPDWVFVDVHIEWKAKHGSGPRAEGSTARRPSGAKRQKDETAGRQHAVVSYLFREDSKETSDIVVLNGQSPAIHQLNARTDNNEKKFLDLSTPEKAAAYLRFFCAMVWGEGGAFQIIERLEDLPREKTSAGKDKTATSENEASSTAGTDFVPKVLQPQPEEGNYRFQDVGVFYAGHLFKAEFLVRSTGTVEMVSDDQVLDLSENQRTIYVRQMRLPVTGNDAFDLEGASAGRYDAFRDIRFAEGSYNALKMARAETAKREGPNPPEFPPRAFEINLTGLSAASLDDDDGMGWWRNSAGRPDDDEPPKRSWLDGLRWQPVATIQKLGASDRTTPLRLKLDGMRYGRTELGFQKGDRSSASSAFGSTAGSALYDTGVNHPERRLWRRKRWLMLQYGDKLLQARTGLEEKGSRRKASGRVGIELPDYNPQPYEELARAFHSQGDFKNSKAILTFRSDMDNWLQASDACGRLTNRRWGTLRLEDLVDDLFRYLVACIRTVFMWLFSKVFDYGLAPVRALTTFVVCIIFGALVTWAAQTHDVLVIETTPVSVAIKHDDDTTQLGIVRFPGGLAGQMVADGLDTLPCGGEIQPLLYAADVFVPLLDLRQETQCRVGNAHVIWDFGKSLYAILGWIVTSITVLSVTGVLRMRAQD